MISKKITDAISEQINIEFASSYLYLSLASQLEDLNYPGAAHWMVSQAQEEINHAMIFRRYLLDRDGKVALKDVKLKPAKVKSMLDAFSASLAHEQYVTGTIYKLVELAEAEKDYAFRHFLGWFLTEQVEEEASARAVVDKLKIAQDSSDAKLMVDSELGGRVDVAPNSDGEVAGED